MEVIQPEAFTNMLSFFRKKSISESTTADDIIPKLEELATNHNESTNKSNTNSIELLKQLGYNSPGELKETIYGKLLIYLNILLINDVFVLIYKL